MGSGKLLKRAIKKYGIEIFTKEILQVYDSEEKMNLAEKILVVIDKEVSYNLCAGGQGGFSFINKKLSREEILKRSIQGNKILSAMPKEWQRRRALKALETREKNNPNWKIEWVKNLNNANFIGKSHKDSSKKLMSEKAKLRTSEKNSQFGTCWISNNLETRKIKKNDVDIWIKKGYKLGRVKENYYENS